VDKNAKFGKHSMQVTNDGAETGIGARHICLLVRPEAANNAIARSWAVSAAIA